MIKQIHLSECDSTQDVLKEQLALNPLKTILVSCDSQKKGKGRGGNHWEDSRGTLCFSINVEPSIQPSFTALELSVLVCRFFEGKGRELKLKWPNDILTSSKKKCGGILVQSSSLQMLAGIGVNLYFDRPEFAGVYDADFEINKKQWSLDLAQFIERHRYDNLSSLQEDWVKRCSHFQQKVKIIEAQETIDGIFKGLGNYGEAIIETELGERHLFNGSLRFF